MIELRDCTIGRKVRLNTYHGKPAYDDMVSVGDIGTVHKVWTSEYALIRFNRALMGIYLDDLDIVEGK